MNWITRSEFDLTISGDKPSSLTSRNPKHKAKRPTVRLAEDEQQKANDHFVMEQNFPTIQKLIIFHTTVFLYHVPLSTP